MPAFTVKCWCCGKETGVEGPTPQLGVHLMEAAQAAGFLGVFDHYWGRMLVFCSEGCIKKCTTKKGTIRMRPPKVTGTDVVVKEKL